MEEEIEAVAERGRHPRIRARVQQRRIRLEEVEVGVHRSARVEVDLAQPLVGRERPVALVVLAVAAVPRVAPVPLDQVEERRRKVERTPEAAGPVVLGERVDGERLRVELLARVARRAAVIHRPVHAAVIGIHEVPRHVLVRPIGDRARIRVLVERRGPRERPEDARVQDHALVGGRIDAQVVADEAAEAAELRDRARARSQNGRMSSRHSAAMASRSSPGVRYGVIARHPSGADSSSTRPTSIGPPNVTRTNACPGGAETS